MEFKETIVFTKYVTQLLSDEDYRSLQNYLIKFPDAGDLIRGGNGLRKIRWKSQGSGKRGGVRAIYYCATAHSQILMLFIYSKNMTEDLTPSQIRQLSKIIEDMYK